MGGSTHLTYSAGVVVIGGGVYAYMKKNSKMSLVASLAIGGAMVLGGVVTNSGQDLLGHSMSLASAASLSSFGLYRLITTKKPFPAVPLLILGGIVTAYETKKVIEWM